MAFVERNTLIESFQDGDFPNGNDFANLIDSCYNYNLSSLPEVFSFVQGASSNWEAAYTYVKANSALIAFKDFVQANYLNLTGGSITGSLSVLDNFSAHKQILSGGKDLYSLFLTTETDSQRLAYNKQTNLISITNGNSVSLSALKTVIEVPFTHQSFNPLANTDYTIGQFSQLSPVRGTPKSYSYISMFDGTITEATVVNDYTAGTGENNTIFLINATQNLTATVTDSIRYSNDLASVNTSLTDTLRLGTPTGWSISSVTPFLQTDPLADGGYMRLDLLTSYIETANLNATTFTSLSVQLAHRQEASGTPGGIEIIYSLDGGSTYIDENLITASNSSTINYLTDSIVITPSEPFTGNVKLRFRRTESSLRRIRDVVVRGLFVSDTKVISSTLNTPLAVTKGDLINVRLRTGSYSTPPTNVLNRVTAKLNVNG